MSSVTVTAILAAYNEEDIIEEVIRSLIADGVLVYVIDNHSTDVTTAIVEQFLGQGVVGLEKFPSKDWSGSDRQTEFDWEGILRRKEELARELDADWFIHHDADEFRESPWTGETLREGIARVDAAGYNAIDFHVLNFVPTSADPDGVGDVRDRLQFYEPGQIFDRLQVKCWKKTGHPVVLTRSGGHEAEFTGRNVAPVRFLLRHYPIRSQAHGERKVFRDRQPRFDPRERARGWHVQYDDLVAGVSFVRDPENLIRYDPEAVRFDVFRRPRDVERLDRLAADNRSEIDRLTGDLARLSLHLRAQDIELVRLRQELDQLRTERVRGDPALSDCHVELAAREATIAAVLASRSWRLTEPLRAVDRALLGRRAESTGRGLALANVPIGGAFRLASDVAGAWGDGWAGTNLRCRVVTRRGMHSLTIAGVIPDELPKGQEFQVRLGDHASTHNLKSGSFRLSVPVTVEAQVAMELRISASNAWRPSATGVSPDTRELAWRVSRIHGR